MATATVDIRGKPFPIEVGGFRFRSRRKGGITCTVGKPDSFLLALYSAMEHRVPIIISWGRSGKKRTIQPEVGLNIHVLGRALRTPDARRRATYPVLKAILTGPHSVTNQFAVQPDPHEYTRHMWLGST